MEDDLETQCMNELFNGEEDVPHYHWHPVSLYHYDGEKIRDLTREEQIEWILKEKGKER